MSTRSIIVVTGKGRYNEETTRLYKHSDGYPTGNLPIIRDALKRSIDQVDDENARWGDDSDMKSNLSVEQVVGHIIGESTSVYGQGAQLEETFREKFKQKHLGNQGDLEWIYLVDVTKKTVKVYGGGYSGEGPQHAFKKGVVDPLTYVECLREECQKQEAFEIEVAMRKIKQLGFKLN